MRTGAIGSTACALWLALAAGCKDDAPKPAATPTSDRERAAKPDEGADAEAASDEAPAPEPPPEAKTLALPDAELDTEDPDAIRVQLPPGPQFAGSSLPLRHPDGAWSIHGLRDDLDERVNEGDAGIEVEVRGYVSEIYVPPACPEGEVCPPPKQPHLWIVDRESDRGRRPAMLVTNYRFTIPEWDAKRWKDVPEVVLELGKPYTFKGKVRRFSDTGFADSRGLLELVAVRDAAASGDWIYPPGAPWHPLEVARMEEENAGLLERARKAAEGG